MNIKKTSIFTFGLLAMAVACRDDDKLPIDFDKINNTNGAYMRVISTPSGSFDPFNVLTSKYEVVLEAVDAQRGKLLDKYTYTVTFNDNTPGNGTIETTPVLIKTVNASAFTVDAKSGYPRTTVTITAPEVLTALGMTAANVLPLDEFIFSQEMFLTDGRKYNVNNTSADVVGGAFFNSPFNTIVPLVCPLDGDLFLGKYEVTSDLSEFGDPVFLDQEVELVEGAQPYQRIFEAIYLEGLGIGNAAQEWTINFICETSVFPKQASNLTCGSGSIYLGPLGSGTYDETNDQTFTVTLVEGPDGDDGGCGFSGSTQITLTFTKVP